MLLPVSAAILLAFHVQAQTVKVEPVVKVKVGRMAAVQVEWDGDSVAWTIPEAKATGDEGPPVDVFREASDNPKVLLLRVLPYKAGTYNVVIASASGGKLAMATARIVAEDPGPGPAPGPGPGPSDHAVAALAAELKPLYAADTASDKADSAAKLAAIYSAGAEVLTSGKVVSAGQFAEALGTATSASGLRADALTKVRDRCGAELGKVLPREASATLTDDIKAKAAATMRVVSSALSTLK